MSHTLTRLVLGNLVPLTVVINNYALGGESVLPSEFNAAGVDGILLAEVPSGQSSLGVPLFPILSGGKVVLYQFVGGSPVEIPATTNLNASVFALVHVTAFSQ